MAIDVFDHHHGIIDDHAGRQDQCQQGEDINRKPEQPDRGNGADQRHRNGSGGNKRRPQRAHESIDHGEHDEDCDGEAGHHFLHRPANEGRIIRYLDDLRVIKPPVEALNGCVDAVGYGDGIGLRPADDAEPDNFTAVQQAVALRLGRSVIGTGHTAQRHIGFKFEGFDIGWLPDRCIGAHQQKLVVRLEAADGHVEIGRPQRPGDIIDRQPETGKPHRFHDDP